MSGKLKHQTVTIGMLRGKVNYWKVTADKRLVAIREVQNRSATYDKAVWDFCKWLAEKTEADGYRGYNLIGKLDWARNTISGHIFLENL
jgi:hypothetical protein